MLRPVRLLTNLAHPFAKKKRVRELAEVKISLSQPTESSLPSHPNTTSYLEMSALVNNLAWETMDFQRLCALETDLLEAVEMHIKKDRFNVDDAEFQNYGGLLRQGASEVNQVSQGSQGSEGSEGSEGRGAIESSLSGYYQRIRALLNNQHRKYDQLEGYREYPLKYQGQMYLQDLTQDPELKALITYFVNNLTFPQRLEAVAEPTLVKRLLTLKRELILQGIFFPTQQRSAQTRRQLRAAQKEMREKGRYEEDSHDPHRLEREDDLQSLQEDDGLQLEEEVRLSNRLLALMGELGQQANQVRVEQILGYEHEFWVDVKANRAKNGCQQDYVIEERQIPNPNPTLLLASQSTLAVKYIIRKQKRKQHSMHFSTKAELLVRVEQGEGQGHLRRVMVEWDGPSNKSSATGYNYRVIDYENLMNGNPTIRTVFQF